MSYFNDNLGVSNKASMKSGCKMYIVNMIDNNQAIRRLCRYLTKTPLSKKGKTYDGEKLINQPDLECSLLEALKPSQDASAIGRDICLIPYAFDESLLEKDKIMIFVSSPVSKFSNKSLMGQYVYEIIVAYPRLYDELLPVGTERFGLIAEHICTMLDGTVSEGNEAKDIGNVPFEVIAFEEEKVSGQGYIKSTIVVVSKPLVDRRF